MIFVDNTGFLSLLSLALQAVMAGVLYAFFFIVPASQAPWIPRMRVAFGALAIGLTAIAVRFILASQEIVGQSWLASWFAATLHGVYLAGKVTYLWFLCGAVASLRDTRWPRFQTWWVTIIAAFGVLGWWLPSIEAVILVQAPLAIAACLGLSLLLWPVRRQRTDVGHWVVAAVLLITGVLWLMYGIAVIVQRQVGVIPGAFWDSVLRYNSFWDLGLQVMLGMGLVTMMMDGSQQRMMAALGERDALRVQVQRDERLRALGTLVGGVAHEINNPLTAILGFADDLMIEDPEARSDAARIVREQAQRCRHIVQRLSVLSQVRDPKREEVSIPGFLHRVASGLQPQFRDARVQLALPTIAGVPVIHAEATALEQVLTNLLVNALQASPPGGCVTLRVQDRRESVAFSVEDEGPGVPIADRERIFEPFFTTKAAGGTGLGLAVASALVRAHNGTIAVESGAKGARFVFTLPRGNHAEAGVRVGASADRKAERPITVAPGSRMLVIDDESLVRATISRHARAVGWQVTEAESAETALERLLDRGEQFDAVACDLRMPGLSGADLYDRLAERAPALLRRLVFITGDLASEDAANFARRTKAPIFAKPFSFPELLSALRERAQLDRAD